MKKKLLIALFVLALLVCIFASCGECKHESYEVKETVPATCVAEGKVVSACTECGEEKTEVLSKSTTHKLTYEEVKPTCSVAGTITETCTVEGCTYTNVKAGQGATGNCNREIRIVTPATCTNAGVSAYVCKDCGEISTPIGFDGTIAPLGHTYERSGLYTDEEKGISFVEGTCQAEGYFARVCQECGYDKDPITRDEYAQTPGYDGTLYDKMEKYDHSFDIFVKTVEPTCVLGGCELYKCVTCDETEEKDQVFPLGHKYTKNETAVEGVNYVINPLPTCINPGVKSYICNVCGEAATEDQHRESVPVVPHVYDDTIADELIMHFEATCTEPEKKVFGCCVDPFCTEEKEFVYSAALGHDEQRGTASCKTEGKTPYTCSRCDFYDERIDEFSDLEAKHTFGEKLTSATCITDATYKCSSCNKVYGPYSGVAQYADGFAHGNHSFDADNPEVIAPKCDAEGFNKYSCIADENCKVTRKDYANTDMNNPDTPRAEDIVARLAHTFGSLTEDGRIICGVCKFQYRDVSTEITNGSGSLCLGCENEVCSCGLMVEWNGYVSPDAAEEIKANTAFTKNEVVWNSLGKTNALVMGEGLVVLTGAVGTTYTIELYDAVGGAVVGTISVTSEAETIVVDLYRYATVAQITITSTADATVSFFSIIK